MVLDKIQKENDIKKLSSKELDELRNEIRSFLVESIARTGGHLSSNLGVVELTMALHLCLDLPKDKIIWDVGHQSYTHKVLTGRKDRFDQLRKYGGLSGFPKGEESPCDSFNTGHSSTSLSAGLGLAQARELKGEDYHVVSVIGDGALTGGMAFEALNNASRLKSNFIIVLNDNNMSISENVGGMNLYLSGFRTAGAYRDLKNDITNSLNKIPKYGEKMVHTIRNAKSSVKQLFVPGMFFEEMGLIYLGPVDGHDIAAMRRVFEEAKRVDGPVLVHVITKKGKGFSPAERFPSRYHGTDPFFVESGEPKEPQKIANYTDVFGKAICEIAKENDKVVAITAAMADGTGLKGFKKLYPKRFFDVGIAEEHAVTFAAGMAKAGLIPVFAVYSSFLQRAYDQMLHDVCLQDLPVVFAVDRAGLVGSDGETHQGIFDLSYLSTIPNLTVMAPKNRWEFVQMLRFAVSYGHPVAIRYPRGQACRLLKEKQAPLEAGKAEMLYLGVDVAMIAVGSMVKTALSVRNLLQKEGISATVVNARFVAPIDRDMVLRLIKNHKILVTMEENVKSGGFGEHIAAIMAQTKQDCEWISVAIPDQFVEQGTVTKLQEKLGLDADTVCDMIRNIGKKEEMI